MTTKTEKRGGRPLMQPHEKRSAQRKVRFTLAEDEYVRLQASRAKLSASEFIRTAALKIKIQPPRSRADTELLRELNAIGVNVNQIARALNRGRDTPGYLDALADKLSRILDEVATRYGP